MPETSRPDAAQAPPPYRPSHWLPGGHLQTVGTALLGRRAALQPAGYARERWTTPDQDFIDVDWLEPTGANVRQPGAVQPLMVLFHGLEGSSASHYAAALAHAARARGWRFAVPHFRGCSGEINRAPRAYHSGDHQEVDWILRRMRERHAGPMLAVGVSLGGNALLRWGQEAGDSASALLCALAAVCAPVDLAAGGHALGSGLNRWLYTPMFLRTMKAKALRKWQQYPGLFAREAMLAARTLYAFDNVFTAPLHGFKDTDDYWARASSKPRLGALRIPSLLLHAANDPFVPAHSLPDASQVPDHVALWRTASGGHVGWMRGRWPPGDLGYLPDAVGAWLQQHLPPPHESTRNG